LLTAMVIGSVSLFVVILHDSGRLGQEGRDDRFETTHLGDPPVLRLDLLSAMTAADDPLGRNLFEYDKPRRQGRPGQTPPPATITAPPRPIRPPAPGRPVGPRSRGPSFNYIGFLGPKDDLIAVFSRGSELFVAQIEEIVDGSYELLEFRYDTVVLEHTGKGEVVRLRMSPS
jgi:hypothetical protein